MFQNQQEEIPGQRHFFERLKSVKTFAEAEKLAEPFPTETLLPELVKQAIAEQNPKLPFYKTPKLKVIIFVLLGLLFLFTDYRVGKGLNYFQGGWLIVIGVLNLFPSLIPTNRMILVANLLYARLRGKHETFYCPEIIRFLNATYSHNDNALKALRGWLFETLPYLIESDTKRLPEDVRRETLRRDHWLRSCLSLRVSMSVRRLRRRWVCWASLFLDLDRVPAPAVQATDGDDGHALEICPAP
jgi:hypothetical protein